MCLNLTEIACACNKEETYMHVHGKTDTDPPYKKFCHIDIFIYRKSIYRLTDIYCYRGIPVMNALNSC